MGEAPPHETQLVETGVEGIVALQGPMGLSDGYREPIRPYQIHGGATFRTRDPTAHLRRTLINRDTRVATIGSCFAVEIHSWLVDQGYSVVECEHRLAWTTSARFGNVFTTAQLRQCFGRAHGQFNPVERWWHWRGLVVEPYRARMAWHSEAEAEASLAKHLDAVRRLVETAEVLICTVGLSETWRNRTDGSAYWRLPLNYDPARHEFHRLDPAENLQNLEQTYAVLREHNPALQLVVTLSPVPLNQTFADESLAVADSYSKASLRVALHEFCRRHPEVVYFPAFEMVRDLEIDPWQADRRHVKRDVVRRVMHRFMTTLGGDPAEPSSEVVAVAESD